MSAPPALDLTKPIDNVVVPIGKGSSSKLPDDLASLAEDAFDGTDDWTIPDRVKSQQFFIVIDHQKVPSLIHAFTALDAEMKAVGIGHLISRKKRHSWGGRVIRTGEIGVLLWRGMPVLCVRPGNYWNWSLTHSWLSKPLDLTAVTECAGLTYAQVGQTEAMVCLDPQNQVFIVRNGGFAAYGQNGTYKVLEIVDTLNLGEDNAVIETDMEEEDITGGQKRVGGKPAVPGRRVLGYKKEVLHSVQAGGSRQTVTVATFFNVPAQNTVVIQNGGLLKAFGAGQHVITNPKCTFRGFFTLGERQRSFRTQPAYTVEGVPVVLHVNLRYRVVDALELTKSYETAFQALRNPAQSAVNAVVSRLSYQEFMKARSLGGDVPDIGHQSWLEAFKSECLRELRQQGLSYGVEVMSFDVLDRKLEGKLGDDLEKQAESVLKNQMQSTQVELQNRINTETEQGKLQVTQVQAKQTETQANAQFLKTSKEADGDHYRRIKLSEAEAEAVRRLAQGKADADAIAAKQEAINVALIAEARARAIKLEADAYATVQSHHAQRIQLEQLERDKFSSLPPQSTLFVGGGGVSGAKGDNAGADTNGVANGVLGAYHMGRGLSLSQQRA
ncbi:hypothetical protein PYCC9005_000643 [Savitreella phatthalungensis]